MFKKIADLLRTVVSFNFEADPIIKGAKNAIEALNKEDWDTPRTGAIFWVNSYPIQTVIKKRTQDYATDFKDLEKLYAESVTFIKKRDAANAVKKLQQIVALHEEKRTVLESPAYGR